VAVTAEIMAAVASPRRREILRLTWKQEVAAGDIHRAMPDVTFGAVSLHLRALADSGLLTTRGDGRFRRYRANRAALGPLARELEHMWRDRLWHLKVAAELEQARRGPKRHSPRTRS
jgi:DNA-binding transcriptional ArsR family regulator